MKKAIITKFLPASNFRGSRIKATAEGGNSLTIGKPHSLGIDGGHCKAAWGLAVKMGWSGFYVGGAMPKDGFCFVNMASDNYSGPDASSLAEYARQQEMPYGREGSDWFFIGNDMSVTNETEILSDD